MSDARRHGAVLPAGSMAATAIRGFHTLDALRGLAAAVVVLFHAGFIVRAAKPPMGFLAVDLFFAMSGFVIAHRYDADLAGGMGAGRFAVLRLVRLYPLFLLGTLLGAVPSVLALLLPGASRGSVDLLPALPPALLMLPSRAMLPELRTLYPLNFVSWSLAFELAANLGYALLFRQLGTRALLATVAAGFGGLCLCAACWHTLEVGFEWPHAVGGFARIAFAFPFGVLLRRATLPDGGGTRSRTPEPRVALPRIPWPVPLVAAIALFYAPLPASGAAAWSLAGCALAVPLILAAAVSGEPPPRLHRLCSLAGVGSYALYSLHVPMVGLWLRAAHWACVDVAHPGPAAAAGFCAILAAACVAAHRCYDRPLRRRLASRIAAVGERAAARPRSGILSLPS